MNDVIRRNLKADYSLLVDIEEKLKRIKCTEKDTVSYLCLSEQIEKIKIVEYNILQMSLLCLDENKSILDL